MGAKKKTSVGLSVFNSSIIASTVKRTLQCSASLILFGFLWNFSQISVFEDNHRFWEHQKFAKDSYYANNIFIAGLKWSNYVNFTCTVNLKKSVWAEIRVQQLCGLDKSPAGSDDYIFP